LLVIGEKWESSEPGMRHRDAGVRKFSFATAAIVLPIPKMRD